MALVLPFNNLNDIFSPPPAVHQLQRYSWSPSCWHQICAKLASYCHSTLLQSWHYSHLFFFHHLRFLSCFTENFGYKKWGSFKQCLFGSCCRCCCLLQSNNQWLRTLESGYQTQHSMKGWRNRFSNSLPGCKVSQLPGSLAGLAGWKGLPNLLQWRPSG